MDFTCPVWLQCLTVQKERDNTIVLFVIYNFTCNIILLILDFYCYHDNKMEKQKNVNLKLTYT